jgi:hypothetical protein
MQLHCPIQPAHLMVEVASALYQCPTCGAGPVDFWSVGFVEVDGDVVGGVYVTWRPELECYIQAYARWEVDASGRRVPGSLTSTLLGYCSTESELRDAPLPARGPPGELVRLREGLFSSPLGEKTDQRGGRGGRSGGGPSPSGGVGPSSQPRRRKRAG